MMKKRIMVKRVIAILLAFSVTITVIPMAGGAFEVSAASPFWKNFKQKSATESTVTLSWTQLTKKQQKKISGIAVCRNGRVVKMLKKTKTVFNDENLKPGTTYNYQLKTYKKTTKYWNRKAKKWQAKKIKGAKKKNAYKYQNSSLIIPIKTKMLDTENEEITEKVNEEDKPELVQITDYMGGVRTVEKGGYLYNDPQYNREIEGKFWPDNINFWGYFYQLPEKNALIGIMKYAGSPRVYVFKGDINKLSYEIPGFAIETIATHNYDKEPVEKRFLIKDGCRIATISHADRSLNDNEKKDFSARFGNADIKVREFGASSAWGCGLGYQKANVLELGIGNIPVTIKYDGSVLENSEIYHINRAEENQELLDVALAAIEANGGKRSYEEDMAAIAQYVYVNYEYSQYTCVPGARIMEAYSIYGYNVYGFMGPGGYKPGDSNYGSHDAFHLDSNPEIFYETQGHF